MKNIKKWTAQDDATLQRMATEGATLQKIATELGRTPMAVLLRTRLLSGLESPLNKRRMDDDYYDQTKTITEVAREFGRRWSKEDGELLQKRFVEGWNIYQLAEHFNRTPSAIIRQLEKQNSKVGDMEALFNQAKFFFGKVRVVRAQTDEKQKQDEEQSPTLTEKGRIVNEEMIHSLNQIIQDFDSQIDSLQESLLSGAEDSAAEGDPNIEYEKELRSKNIPESAAFLKVIEHLDAVISYIRDTQLDSRTSILIDIELLKARRQLITQLRDRRIGLNDAYTQ